MFSAIHHNQLLAQEDAWHIIYTSNADMVIGFYDDVITSCLFYCIILLMLLYVYHDTGVSWLSSSITYKSRIFVGNAFWASIH